MGRANVEGFNDAEDNGGGGGDDDDDDVDDEDEEEGMKEVEGNFVA